MLVFRGVMEICVKPPNFGKSIPRIIDFKKRGSETVYGMPKTMKTTNKKKEEQ